MGSIKCHNGKVIFGYQVADFRVPPWQVSQYKGRYIITIILSVTGQGGGLKLKNGVHEMSVKIFI